jgi:hypothetical protein
VSCFFEITGGELSGGDAVVVWIFFFLGQNVGLRMITSSEGDVKIELLSNG